MSPPYSRRYGGQTIQQRANEHDQDLKRLIDDALAVQDGLNTIKNRLANLDSAVNTTPLTSLALDCQEKFYDLLMSSRDSASILMAHLEDFTQNIVPLVQDPEVSQSDKIIEVKSAAELIATTAKKSPIKTQEEFKDLKTVLTGLGKMVNEFSSEMKLCTESSMSSLLSEIYGLEVKLAAIFAHQRNIVGRLIDVVEAVPVAMGGHAHDLNTATESAMSTELREERHTEVMAKKFIAFVQATGKACLCLKQFLDTETAYKADSKTLRQKRSEVARLRSDIEVKQLEIERARQGLKMVTSQFMSLNGKLGQFEDIWNRLLEDVRALHEYLENPDPSLTAKDFQMRVVKEGVLYKNIRGALEMYAIRARHTY